MATAGDDLRLATGESLSAAVIEPSRHEAMQRSIILVPVVASLLALSVAAQTGRTMRLLAPVVIGQAASMVIEHPPSLAGHQFAMAMCSPNYPGALSISSPGVAEGVLRLDPLAYAVLGVGVLDASGQSPTLRFLVPNDPLLVGASGDFQGADIDGAGLITLTDNDLEIEVAGPPPASLNMVAIAPGTFQRGSGVFAMQNWWTHNELPVHAVTITQPFWMGKYEVTQAEYVALMGSNPSFFQGSWAPGAENRPVETLTWTSAVQYCCALTVQEAAAGRLPSGYEYRLSTEAEWEYCCRAGTTTEWNAVGGLSCVVANILDENLPAYCVPGYPYGGQTTVVGAYAANAWGLHDMHGNVREWCLDSWDESANYPAGAVSDPLERSGSFRVVRGGCWFYDSMDCRSAYRWRFDPVEVCSIQGFRVVCAPVIP